MTHERNSQPADDWRTVPLGDYPSHTRPDFSDYPGGYPGELLTGGDAQAAVGWYTEAAAQQKIKSTGLSGEETFCADRTAFAYPDEVRGEHGPETVHEWHVIRDRMDPAAVTERLRLVGHYDTNGRLIAYVDGEGRMMMARKTDANTAALRTAGYRSASFMVPFSTGKVVFDGRQSRTAAQLELFEALDASDALMRAAVAGVPYVGAAAVQLSGPSLQRLYEGGTDEDYAVAAAELRDGVRIAAMEADLAGPAVAANAVGEKLAAARAAVREWGEQ